MTEQDVLNVKYQAALEMCKPSVLMRPAIFIDGNQWCALYGQNIQDGVAGFGDTPELAMADFDKNWSSQRIEIRSDGRLKNGLPRQDAE